MKRKEKGESRESKKRRMDTNKNENESKKIAMYKRHGSDLKELYKVRRRIMILRVIRSQQRKMKRYVFIEKIINGNYG